MTKIYNLNFFSDQILLVGKDVFLPYKTKSFGFTNSNDWNSLNCLEKEINEFLQKNNFSYLSIDWQLKFYNSDKIDFYISINYIIDSKIKNFFEFKIFPSLDMPLFSNFIICIYNNSKNYYRKEFIF